MGSEIDRLCRLSSFGNSMVLGTFDLKTFSEYWATVRPRLVTSGEVFYDLGARYLGAPRVAGNPDEWLRDSVRRGCTRFELCYTLDPRTVIPKIIQEVATVDGSEYARTHLLQLHFPHGTEVWCDAQMLSGDYSYKELPLVRYFGAPIQEPIVQSLATVAQARDQLQIALTDISRFDRQYRGSGWSHWFDDAMDKLTQDEPEESGNAALLAPGVHPLRARQLVAAVAAAEASNVLDFHGMGSWFDSGHGGSEEKIEYSAVTSALWQAVHVGTLVGVNDIVGTGNT